MHSDPSRWIYKLSFVTCGGWGGGTGRAGWGGADPVGGCYGLVLAGCGAGRGISPKHVTLLFV